MLAALIQYCHEECCLRPDNVQTSSVNSRCCPAFLEASDSAACHNPGVLIMIASTSSSA